MRAAVFATVHTEGTRRLMNLFREKGMGALVGLVAMDRNSPKSLWQTVGDYVEGIEELVFLTDGFATSESSDPWEASIQTVYTTNGQLGNYMNDPQLGRRISYILSPFEDDNVIWALADKEHYFPSAYMELDNVEGIFENNTGIETFDDFSAFGKVKSLVSTFAGTTNLKSITIPSSVESIADADSASNRKSAGPGGSSSTFKSAFCA